MVTRLLLVIWASFASLHEIPAPVDLQIRETALGEITVSWKDNSVQDTGLYKKRYDVVLKTATERKEYEHEKKQTYRTLTRNGEVSAQIATVLYSQNNSKVAWSQWAEVHLPPLPGDNGTSITNLSCITYLDISGNTCLNCTWLAGENAPEDTKYFLFYRYFKVTEECQQYSFDVLVKTNIGCHFSKSQIKIKSEGILVVFVNGSSEHSTIQPFYQIFDTDSIERIFPPENVTVFQEEDFLEIHWLCPRSSISCEFFMFEVKATDLKTNAEEVRSSPINKMKMLRKFTSKHSVCVRARGTERRKNNKNWSEWSAPVFTAVDLQQDNKYIVVIASILATSALIFFAIMLLKRYQICSLLFPPVPSPEVTLKKVFLFPESEELSGANPEPELISCVEESQDNEDHKAALMMRM